MGRRATDSADEHIIASEKPRNDITVKIGGGKFNYRVGAIIIDSGEILMVRNSIMPHYFTIGGRMQFGEAAHEAVLREAFEETKVHFEIDRLAYIHENFFLFESDGEFYHEVALYFLMKPNSLLREVKLDSFSEEEFEDVSFQLHWLPVNGLSEYSLFPEFFKTELLNITQGIKHFVTKNEITTIAS